MPSYTVDWTSAYTERWSDVLASLIGRPNLRALEIGAYEGRTTRWLLDHVLTHHTALLHVIDWFRGSPELAPINGLDLFRRFHANVGDALDRVQVHCGRSEDVLREDFGLADFGSLDLAYVDGSHDAPDVLSDVVLVWPLLKPGAFLIFDDYGFRHTEPDGRVIQPKPAIDAFLALYEGRYELVEHGWQVILRKPDDGKPPKVHV